MAQQPSPAAPPAQQMAAAQPAPAAPPPAAPAATAPVEAAPVQTAAAPVDDGPVLRNGSAVAMPGPGTAMGGAPGAPAVTATQLAAVPSAPAMPASSAGPVAVDMSVLNETGAAAPAPVQTALASPRGQPAGVIYFYNGSASLSAKDRAVLRNIARLQRQNGAVIQVVGHASMHTRNTDLQRQAMVNQNLSVVRASAVARTLRQFGVSSGRIQTAAAGAQQPVYVESMPNGEAGNRRVEIYFGYN
jgi:outer membrane protein OmpA-like peptidoglycan-associated protein